MYSYPNCFLYCNEGLAQIKFGAKLKMVNSISYSSRIEIHNISIIKGVSVNRDLQWHIYMAHGGGGGSC